MEVGYVYILASRENGTLYVGVTSDLQGRVSEHKQGIKSGFASKYGATNLVWYERHDGIESAIQREKSLKKYRREWKVNLIRAFNPYWDDLFESCYDRDNPFRPTFVREHHDELKGPMDHRDGAR